MFEFKRLAIEDVILVRPQVFNDERGFFMENYKKSEFAKNGITADFCQDNHSKSSYGVLRGLHYQSSPKSQAKLVRCVSGEIFDVAVDIRQNSKTFGKWVGVVLSEENKNMLFIPKGFAHGFVTLSEKAEIVYKVDEEFSAEHDCGIAWNDEDIAVDWHIDFVPILSEKDKNRCCLKDLKQEELL